MAVWLQPRWPVALGTHIVCAHMHAFVECMDSAVCIESKGCESCSSVRSVGRIRNHTGSYKASLWSRVGLKQPSSELSVIKTRLALGMGHMLLILRLTRLRQVDYSEFEASLRSTGS